MKIVNIADVIIGRMSCCW